MTNYYYQGSVYTWNYDKADHELYKIEYDFEFISDIPPDEIDSSEFIQDLKDEVESETPNDRTATRGFNEVYETSQPVSKKVKVDKYKNVAEWQVDDTGKKHKKIIKNLKDSDIYSYY